MTIDIGSNAGIKKNMTVLSQTGIAGVVKDVFPTTALVMLATDPSFKIGVRIAGTQQIGICQAEVHAQVHCNYSII